MTIQTIGVSLGKAQKCAYVNQAPGAALSLPRVVNAPVGRQRQDKVPLRTMCISLSLLSSLTFSILTIANAESFEIRIKRF